MDDRNGATWIRDCMLDSTAMAQAVDRLQTTCRDGLRHFSAIRRSVPLRQAKEMETTISRIEDEVEGDFESGVKKAVRVAWLEVADTSDDQRKHSQQQQHSGPGLP